MKFFFRIINWGIQKGLNTMAYTVTTTRSYGQRLKSAITGVVGGFFMFIGGTILLFFNEGNFVKERKAINETQKIAVHVEDVSQVNPEYNGKTIHASAFADTKDTLTDSLFGVNAVAIGLNRKVEYFQYEEHSSSQKRDKIGGGEETVTTYTYEKAWTSEPVNSREFKDPDYQMSNEVLTTVPDKKQLVANVTFGAYKLPAFLISSIRGDTPSTPALTETMLEEWAKQLRGTNMVHVTGNVVYFGNSPTTPTVGDLRITLTQTMPANVSLIAKVNGQTFEKFVASNGREFSRLDMGTLGMDAMFAKAHSENAMLLWILRIVGILLVIFGLRGIFGIITALLKVLPFLANIVGLGIGIVCFMLGLSWSLLVISTAWLIYRPLIGLPLLIASIALIFLLKKKAAGATPAPPSP